MEGDAPLVGNKAPDFEAEAVFDQEFIKVRRIFYHLTCILGCAGLLREKLYPVLN